MRGPIPDDEVAIGEATAGEFIGKAAEYLHLDEAAVKDRMKALGYTTIPGKPAERVKAYRAMAAACRAQTPADRAARLSISCSPPWCCPVTVGCRHRALLRFGAPKECIV